ncbi:MAG: hypothetical protein P8M80_11060 [Pirellulaceae bacterium]|nr:hypothetical protein [Pirellulaceae bacterium]
MKLPFSLAISIVSVDVTCRDNIGLDGLLSIVTSLGWFSIAASIKSQNDGGRCLEYDQKSDRSPYFGR